jgi:hypothetical protein
MILRQLIEIRVDTEKFDLVPYSEEAVSAGWADDPANGIWYLAESIAGEHEERGLSFEIVPNDPYVGES